MSDPKITVHVGSEVVGQYRGYDIVRSDSGVFGFNAWCNYAQSENPKEYMCFYTSKEATEKAIDAIFRMITPRK